MPGWLATPPATTIKTTATTIKTTATTITGSRGISLEVAMVRVGVAPERMQREEVAEAVRCIGCMQMPKHLIFGGGKRS